MFTTYYSPLFLFEKVVIVYVFNMIISVDNIIYLFSPLCTSHMSSLSISLSPAIYYMLCFNFNFTRSLNKVAKPEDVADLPSWVASEGALVALRFGATQLNRTVLTGSQKSARDSWLNGAGSSGTGVIYMHRFFVCTCLYIHTNMCFVYIL